MFISEQLAGRRAPLSSRRNISEFGEVYEHWLCARQPWRPDDNTCATDRRGEHIGHFAFAHSALGEIAKFSVDTLAERGTRRGSACSTQFIARAAMADTGKSSATPVVLTPKQTMVAAAREKTSGVVR